MVDMEQFAFFVLEVYAFACFKIFLVRLKVICFLKFHTFLHSGASRCFQGWKKCLKWSDFLWLQLAGFKTTGNCWPTTGLRIWSSTFFFFPLLWFQTKADERPGSIRHSTGAKQMERLWMPSLRLFGYNWWEYHEAAINAISLGHFLWDFPLNLNAI